MANKWTALVAVGLALLAAGLPPAARAGTTGTCAAGNAGLPPGFEDFYERLSAHDKDAMKRLFASCVGKDCCTEAEVVQILDGTAENRACVAVTDEPSCASGMYNSTRTHAHTPCPAGYFCPAKIMCKLPCTEGAFCPAPVGAPTNWTRSDVPEENVVAESRECLFAGKCCVDDSGPIPTYTAPLFIAGDGAALPTWVCPGTATNAACKKGYYCANNTVQEICPKDHFCREGCVDPYPCSVLASCPEGTSAATQSLHGLIVIIVLCLVLFGGIALYERRTAIMLTLKSFVHCTWLNRAVEDVDEDDTEFLDVAEVEDMRQQSEASKGGDSGAPAARIIPKTFTVNFTFNNLGLQLGKKSKDGPMILQGVTGELRSHRVTAVMGPSGAGKTTFLSTLSGKAYYGNQRGDIKINGKVEKIQKYKKIVGFVPQEDTMHRQLKVREVLMYQALLRLPQSWSDKAKRDKVDQVLDLLELERIKEYKIGDEESRGVSGGQRKRVNIGMELVADPTVLFLDEPTSGLDSTSSLTVLRALKRVAAEGGLTIVTVLHQPRFEIFQMFDDCLFLAVGGRTVYLGPTVDVAQYFGDLGCTKPENVNPADFYMDTIFEASPECKHTETRDLAAEWDARRVDFKKGRAQALSPYEGDAGAGAATRSGRHLSVQAPGESSTDGAGVTVLEIQGAGAGAFGTYTPRKSASFLMQVWIFFKREIALHRRMVKMFAADLFLLLLGASVVGAINKDGTLKQQMQAHFMSAMVFGLVIALAHLRVFGTERAVFWRESARGVNRLAYFVALNVANLPMQCVSALVYQSITYTLVSPRGSLWVHLVGYFLVAWAISGTAYVTSIAVSPKNSQMFITVSTMVSALLGGFEPTLKSLEGIGGGVGQAFTSLSFARWLLEAMLQAEVKQVPLVKKPEAFVLMSNIGYELGDEQENINTCLFALFCFGLGIRVIAFVLLVRCHRGAQQ